MLQLQELAFEIDSSVHVELFAGDLALKETQSRLKSLLHAYAPNCVINCAGVGLYGDAFAQDTALELRMIDVNATALVFITLEAIRAMLLSKKTGVVCNISSALSFFPTPGMSVYAATKAFVNSFSEAIDVEARQHGIRVLTSCPGQVYTNFRKRASQGMAENYHHFAQMSAEEVAHAICKQIEQQKSLRIINWKTRCATFFARCLPKRIVQAFLYKKIKEICD